MDLNIYEIIQGPVVTDKAVNLNQQLKKLVVRVHPQANKTMIKKAIEKLFEVKVAFVNIIVQKGKFRQTRRGREETQGQLKKKAIVTLKPGQELNLFDQAGKVAVSETANEGITK